MKQFLVFGVILGIAMITPLAYGQIFEKATFQETVTILYDQKISESTVISVGFETTDNQEIRFPDELIQKINDNEKIRAVVFTNSGECVIGVTSEEQCIMINFDYQELKGDGGIRMVQDSAKEISKSIANDLNEILRLDAKFHSTFIHTNDDINVVLETSGVISGRGTVSATYTMPKQSTDFLFTDLSGILIPKEIRNAGGCYDITKQLSKDDESIFSLSIIPFNDDSNLYILKIGKEIKNSSKDISRINILESLNVDSISRSKIFDGHNNPLNSIIQLVVIPNEPSKIDAISTHAITDVTNLDGISKKGWFFTSPSGHKIDAKFLFGKENTVLANELQIEIGAWDGEKEMSFYSVESIEEEYSSMKEFINEDAESETQYIVLGIIIAIGIGAAIFYLKGYKPKH